MLVLRVLSGPLAGRDLPVGPTRQTLGSAASADLRLLGAGVLPHHAVVLPDSGQRLLVRSLPPGEPARVNGSSQVEALVGPGDLLGFGDVQLIVVLVAGQAPAVLSSTAPRRRTRPALQASPTPLNLSSPQGEFDEESLTLVGRSPQALVADEPDLSGVLPEEEEGPAPPPTPPSTPRRHGHITTTERLDQIRMRLSTEEVSALLLGEGTSGRLDEESSRRQLKAIFAINSILGHTHSIDELLQRVLEVVMSSVGARHGVAVATGVGARGEDLVVGVRRDRDGSFSACPDLRISRTIMDHVAHSGEAVLTTDATQDDRFRGGHSVVDLSIKGAVCAPLSGRQGIAGMLLVESDRRTVFGQEALRLVACIGDMAGKVLEGARLYQEGLQRERLATVGRTLAGTAHYMKNLLTGIQVGAQLVDMGLAEQDMEAVDAGWRPVGRSLALLGDLVLNMLDYSKDRAPRRELIDLEEVIEAALDGVRVRCARDGVTLAVEVTPDLPPLHADPVGLHRALLNLLTNAMEALPAEQGGQVWVRATPDADGTGVRLTVEDDGDGIPAGEMERVCELFFSTKGNRGTGFGLAVTRKIANEHGGELAIDSVVGEGTRVSLLLPAAPPDEGTAEATVEA